MSLKNIILSLMLLFSASVAKPQSITNQVPSISEFSGEIVSKVKLAKEYFMESNGPDVGRDFEERTANLSKRIVALFQEFREKRTTQYQNVQIVFTGSDWATGKHTSKTVSIPNDVYIFTKIVRTTNGDWKGGPIINGADRSKWFEGDIPGGSVTWVTGGHGSAETAWTINAKYSAAYISSTINNEEKSIKEALHAVNLPTE